MSQRKLFRSIHGVWRLLPKRARGRLFLETTAFLARPPSPHAASCKPITVCGPLSSSIGIGWGARENAKILADAGFDMRCLDVGDSIVFDRDLPHSGDWKKDDPREMDLGTLLLHANPPQIPYLFLSLGKQFIKQKYVIAYSVWELPQLPPDWQHNLRFVHHVWCPSEFSAQAFRSATDKPVEVVPHAIEPDKLARPNRRMFAIPEGAFVVLCALHLGSGLTRKNPLAAIRAFKSAFGASDQAFLLVKVSQSEFYPDRLARIESEIAGTPNILLMGQALSDLDYWSLLHSVDAVLSLHRSEGFGLVMAQAMALGKVAIATGWSGNMDYMTPDNSLPVDYSLVPVEDPEGNYRAEGQKWAEPNIEHAARLLRQLASDRDMRNRLGQRATETMLANFSSGEVARKIVDKLAELGIVPNPKHKGR